MDKSVERFLNSIVANIEFPRHTASMNPMEHSYWKNLIDIAANSLETVSTGCFDRKLVAITKLLQAWIEEKEAEKAQQEFQTQWKYLI